MARVVCQVVTQTDRLTLLWSDGSASFPPYTLEGPALAELARLAAEAQAPLAQLGAAAGQAHDWPSAAAKLSQIGHALYRLLFQLDSSTAGIGQEVQGWLRDLTSQGAVDRLEIVGDSLKIPWNIVYDVEPTSQEFGHADAAGWQGFWGRRYNLTGGRRVQWLRGRLLPAKPVVVFAIDPEIRSALPAPDLLRLDEFIAAHVAESVGSLEALRDAFRDKAVDIVYCLGRSDQGGLLVGRDLLTPDALAEVLGEQAGNGRTLAIVNPCCPANGPDNALQNFERFSAVGFIAAWQPLAPTDANRFGLDLLQGLLAAGHTVSQTVAAVRHAHPVAALLYFAACPADLQLANEAPPPVPSNLPLGPLPFTPYLPFLPLDESSVCFLVGREFDTLDAATLLDDSGTRLLLVHGPSGAGKSSLIRAGVVPYLENTCIGYRAMRQRVARQEDASEPPASEREYPVLGIRATSDLPGQLALALLDFCAQPLTYATPLGRTVTVNLPGLLQGVVEGRPVGSNQETADELPDAESLRVELRQEPELFGLILARLAAELPFELVVNIEQGEELFSLAPPEAGARAGTTSLALLRAACAIDARAKIVVSLRTDFLGRFLDPLLRSPGDARLLRAFLVHELTEEELVEVILQSTSTEPLPGSDEVPDATYRFQYEQGLAETIARDARRLGATNQESPLPLVHALGMRLWQVATARSDGVARAGDLKKIGGVDKGLSKYVEYLLARVATGSDRKELRNLLLKLFLRQPDGALTRDLLAQESLPWRGATPLDVVAADAAADNVRLLDVSWLNIGGREENYLSLGHDALAPVAAQMAEENSRRLFGRTKTADMLWIAIPLLILAGVVAFMQWQTAVNLRNKSADDTDMWEKLTKDTKEELQEKSEFVQAMEKPAELGHLRVAWESYLAGDLVTARQALLAVKPLGRGQDFRSFESRWLWGQMGQDAGTFVSHHRLITGVALTPDGALLATTAADAVRVWNVARNEELFQLRGADLGPAYCLAFSPDGSVLATGTENGSVRLWKIGRQAIDNPRTSVAAISLLSSNGLAALGLLATSVQPAASPQDIGNAAAHTGRVNAIAFSPDGKSIATAGADGDVKLWDVTLGKREVLHEHTGPVLALAFAPDGKWLATSGADKLIHVWETATAKKKETLKGHVSDVAALAWSPDGKILVSGGAQTSSGLENGVIKLWDSAGWKERPGPSPAVAPVFALAFADGPTSLAVAGQDNVVRFFDLETAKERLALRGHLGWVRSLAAARAGQTIATGSYDGTAKVWQPQALAHRDLKLQPSAAAVLTLAFTADEKRLATGSADGTVKVFDLESGRELATLAGHKEAVRGIAWDKDGKALLTGSSDGSLKLWDVDPRSPKFGTELAAVKAHDKEVTCVGFTTRGKPISGSADGTCKVWGVQENKFDKDPLVVDLASGVRCLTVIQEARDIAITGHEDGKGRVWSLATGQLAEMKSPVLSGHTGPVTGVAYMLGFIPGGTGERRLVLLTASTDRTMKAWDTSGSDLYTLRGHGGPVTGMSAANEDAFVSCSTDQTVKLWGPTNWSNPGKLILTERFMMPGVSGRLRAVTCSAGGRYLAAAGEDGVVVVWRSPAPDKRR